MASSIRHNIERGAAHDMFDLFIEFEKFKYKNYLSQMQSRFVGG
jgi:hypothetical protein